MQKQGRGAIINISSVASLVGLSGNILYGIQGPWMPSPGAVAVRYAQRGIRCNVGVLALSIHPWLARLLMAEPGHAPVHLAQYAVRRPGKPEEVANLILYLASDESTWVTGTTFLLTEV
ncbi:MAG: SDR family oxidoreductase [Nitrospira sp.]